MAGMVPIPGQVSHRDTGPAPEDLPHNVRGSPPRTQTGLQDRTWWEASQGRVAAPGASRESGLPALPSVQVPEPRGLTQHLLNRFGSRLGYESEKPLCSSHNMVTQLWCLFPHPQRGTTSNFSFLTGDLKVVRIHVTPRELPCGLALTFALGGNLNIDPVKSISSFIFREHLRCFHRIQ